jgi:hypothetical protein
MNAKWILAALLLLTLVVTVVSADTYTNISSVRSVTTKGAYDILVSLGIEYILPLTTAYWWYNLISIGLLIGVTSIASKRNTGSVALLIPVIVGMCIYFGWLHSPTATITYGMLCFSAIIAAAIYMNDSLHMNFGIPGPGSKFLNIVFYMIILQAIVGFVNTGAIWGENNVGTTTSAYSNVDLQKEVTSMSNSGGLLNDALSFGSALLDIAMATIRVFISVVVSVFLFGVAILLIFPFLNTPLVVAFLAVITVVLDYLFIKYMADAFYFKALGVNDL